MDSSFLSALVMAGAAVAYIAFLVIIFKLSAYFKIALRPLNEKIAAVIAVVFLGVAGEVIFSATKKVDYKFAIIFFVVGMVAGLIMGYTAYRDQIKKQPKTRQQRRHLGK